MILALEVSAYALDESAEDVAQLIHHYGHTKASIVGHDWGSAVAWWLGMTRPDTVQRLAILQVPHPGR